MQRPSGSRPIRTAKAYASGGGLHAERLVRPPIVAKLDLVSDDTYCAPLRETASV